MKPEQRRRCVIYTRKSTEEGLDQAFNSLDAQRQACEAYILSQAGEGWQLVKTHYDDGGFSGGSMERPALKALLEDIDRGRIDIVVVYKVDRLTRSLADFARIVERFEGHGASFVSVTQAFNTTTSMGRLTLNVLLSFAQFEREVTGERIRDKIAASKAKGMWMGGNPLLGYDPVGRTLEVNPDEAETVRLIFRRYLELGSVHELSKDLADRGVRAKAWITRKDTRAGGGVFARGALYHLLRNRHYLGEIVHKGVAHPGQHDAIVDAELFDAVQARLGANINARRTRVIRPGGSHLAGLVFDDASNPMSPTHARGQTGKAHRYYVSTAVLTGRREAAGSLGRVPAKALEDLVSDRLSLLIKERAFSWEVARGLIKRVVIGSERIVIELRDDADASNLSELIPASDQFDVAARAISVAIRMGRRGGAVRILDHTGRRIVDRAELNATLINAIGKAWRWRMQLLNGEYPTSTALARAEGLTQTGLHHYLRLAYLAPDLIREILDGRQRPGLALDQLCDADLPLAWDAQRRLFSSRAS